MFCIIVCVFVVISSASSFPFPNDTESDSSIRQEIQSLRESLKSVTTKVGSITDECSTIRKGVCGECICRDDNRLVTKYYCDCRQLSVQRDCVDHLKLGRKVDGVYKVHQNNMKTIHVFCDQSTDNGGWTVLQRRVDGSVDFYRNWQNYLVGFGDLQHEFWLGNENLFTMSLQGLYPSGNELRVELQDWEGQRRFAKYESFQVGDATTFFELHVGKYSGNAGDGGRGMSLHNGMKFSTFDKDHDTYGVNCAAMYKGGWWYKKCHTVNLNGRFYHYGEMGGDWTGIHWYPFHGHKYPLPSVEMKMRRSR